MRELYCNLYVFTQDLLEKASALQLDLDDELNMTWFLRCIAVAQLPALLVNGALSTILIQAQNEQSGWEEVILYMQESSLRDEKFLACSNTPSYECAAVTNFMTELHRLFVSVAHVSIWSYIGKFNNYFCVLLFITVMNKSYLPLQISFELMTGTGTRY